MTIFYDTFILTIKRLLFCGLLFAFLPVQASAQPIFTCGERYMLSPALVLKNGQMQEWFSADNFAALKNIPSRSAGQPLSATADEDLARISAMFVGDLHCNYEGFVKLLKRAKFIDDNLNWIAGSRMLTQLGDVVDRGSEKDAEKIWDLLDKLQMQAYAKGGSVVRLIGNHEMYYLKRYYRESPESAIRMGMFLKKTDRGYDITLARKWREKILDSLRAGNIQAACFYRKKVVAHAGVHPYFSGQYENPGLMVGIFNHILGLENFRNSIFESGASRGGKAEYPGILGADYYKDLLPVADQLIPMILAHTNTNSKKIETWGAGHKVINVDVGMSRHYGNSNGGDAWVFFKRQTSGKAINSAVGSSPKTVVPGLRASAVTARITLMESSI